MPDYCSALLNRAITRVMLKDMDGAMEDFNKLAVLDPNSPQVYFNSAHLYKELGKFDQAEADYTKVISLTPDDSTAFFKRGEIRGHQSRLKDAMSDYSHWVIKT